MGRLYEGGVLGLMHGMAAGLDSCHNGGCHSIFRRGTSCPMAGHACLLGFLSLRLCVPTIRFMCPCLGGMYTLLSNEGALISCRPRSIAQASAFNTGWRSPQCRLFWV